jgi:hypothetical protein
MTESRLTLDTVLENPAEPNRHWAPKSQKFATGDILLDYLRNGWALDPLAAVERVYYSGYRCVEVFHFVLANGAQAIKMPVVGNPRVYRLIEEYQIRLFDIQSTEIYS